MAFDDRPSIALAENLVTLLAHSNEHGRIVASAVEPRLFEGELRVFAERLTDFWDKYGRAPGDHTADLFADIIEDKKNARAQTFKRLLINTSKLAGTINTQYVLDQLETFNRQQRLKEAILQASRELTSPADPRDSLERVETLLTDAARKRDLSKYDSGVGINNVEELISFLEEKPREFDTGIQVLDRHHIVPMRGKDFGQRRADADRSARD